MTTRIIDRKTFQSILTQLRTESFLNVEKDALGGYTVTVAKTGDQILKGIPGRGGYLSTFDPQLFA